MKLAVLVYLLTPITSAMLCYDRITAAAGFCSLNTAGAVSNIEPYFTCCWCFVTRYFILPIVDYR